MFCLYQITVYTGYSKSIRSKGKSRFSENLDKQAGQFLKDKNEVGVKIMEVQLETNHTETFPVNSSNIFMIFVILI